MNTSALRLTLSSLLLGAALSAHAQNFSFSTPPPDPPTTVFSYTGTTVGGPTFNRPTSPTSLSGVGTNVAYNAFTFTAPTTASYNFLSLGTNPTNWDNYTVLYGGAFNPASPLTNALRTNDDFPTIGRSGFNGVSLTGGNSYTFVTTGFGNSDAGAFSNTIIRGGSSGTAIPDNTPAGVNLEINVPQNGTITSLKTVTLQGIAHTWVGDLSVTLSHGGRTIVLLDRLGKTASSIVGSSSDLNGDYTFDPTGSPFPTTGTVIAPGTYQPASNSFGSFPSLTADFSLFNGLDLAGVWTLNVSDNAALDTGSIAGFRITGTAVPEPGTVALLTAALLTAGGMTLRRRGK